MADERERPRSSPRSARDRRLAQVAWITLVVAGAFAVSSAAEAQTKKKKKHPTSQTAPKASATPAAGSASAAASAAASAPVSAPASAPAARRPKAALSRLADALARELERAPAGALVVSGPLVSDISAPRGPQLVVSLAAQLAGRRGGTSWARAEPTSLAAARDLARSEPALIYISIEIAAGQLRATADVYPVPKTVWSRVRAPAPGPIAHAFAQAPIDAEIRSFLAPVPLVSAAAVDRAKNFESDVVALACGDINQDGAPEIVSVSRRRISAVRLQGGKVLPIASRSWSDLVQVHPSPLREPIAFATLIERPVAPDPASADDLGAFVDVALTDRARSIRLDGKLQLAGAFPGLALPDGDSTACVKTWGLLLTGPVQPCAPSDPAPLLATVGGQYDAIASAEMVSPRGDSFTIWAGREKGALELKDTLGHKQVIDSAGAQLAVGDLDQDGEPEILTSLDVTNPMEDAVIVRSWRRDVGGNGGKTRELYRLPAAAGVRALAVCPPDGPGRNPFVVATADEIWVVR